MAVCSECKREYLDSYEVCPFCAKRWQEEEAARTPPIRPERRSRRVNPAVAATIAAIASMSGIIVYVIVQFVFGSMVVQTDSSPAGRQACFMNQTLVERAVMVRYAETQESVTDIDVLFPDYVASYPVCPDGVYTYTWNPQIPRFECSVHGWHRE